MSLVFHKSYSPYASISIHLGLFTDVGTDIRWLSTRCLPPPPTLACKRITATVCTFYKLFKLLFSLVSQCDFIISHSQYRVCSYSCMYMWIGTTHPPSFTTLWLVGFFSFQNHFWRAHDTKHRYHGWNLQNICNVNKRVVKPEGAISINMFIYPYKRELYEFTLVQTNSTMELWFTIKKNYGTMEKTMVLNQDLWTSIYEGKNTVDYQKLRNFNS